MDSLYLLWPSFHSSSVFTQPRWFQEGVGQFIPALGDCWKCVCHALLIHNGALTAQQRRWDGTHSQLILTCHRTSVSGASGSTPHLMCLSISCCQSPVQRYMLGPHTQTRMASVTGTWHRLIAGGEERPGFRCVASGCCRGSWPVSKSSTRRNVGMFYHVSRKRSEVCFCVTPLAWATAYTAGPIFYPVLSSFRDSIRAAVHNLPSRKLHRSLNQRN